MKIYTKKSLETSNGITLIALVITIIVLLILAGISISMLSGNNGILTRTTDAKEKSEIAQIQEEIQLAWNTVQVDGIPKGWTLDNKATALKTELDNEDSTKSSTVAKQSDNKSLKVTYKGYETTINTETGSMTSLAKVNSSMNPLEQDLQIGDVITNFVSNKKSELDAENVEWIYFGKDSNGNNLLTTSKPISNKLTLSRTAQEWALLDDDNGSINNICSQYIGENATKSRSITLEDINNIIGFNESEYLTDDYTYSFGSNLNFSAKQVNFWYPSKTSSNYWQNPAEIPTQFKRNDYSFGSYGDGVYLAPGKYDENDAQFIKDNINSNYLAYIFGTESNYYDYVLSSGAIEIESDVVNYNLFRVSYSWCCADDNLCGSGVDDGGLKKWDSTYLGTLSLGIRPVVVIPTTISLTKAQ